VNPELLPIRDVPPGGGATSRYVLTPTAVANIDQIGVMAYDFATDQHSLWQRSINSLDGWRTYLSGITINDYQTGQHVSPEKLLFGLPFYGRAGSSWGVDGQGYGDIVNKWLSDQPGGTIAPVDQDSLWAGLGGYPGGAQWYFNGRATINAKTGYALDENVGGVMIWDLSLDHLDASKNYDQYSLLPGIRATVNARGTLTAAGAFNVNAEAVSVTFGAKINSGTIGPADLDLINLTTDAKIDTAASTVVYNSGTNVGKWTVASHLPDGNYRATLRAGAVRDQFGDALASDVTTNFFVLAGDANRNRTVDFSDLVTLSQNYNGTGKTYSQGDFDYDGDVDFQDLVILAKNYGKTLPTSGAKAAMFSTAPVEWFAATDVGHAERHIRMPISDILA
jgi:hypothetical protein